MKSLYVYTLVLVSFCSIVSGQQIKIDYLFTENYPKFPNPPVKDAYLYIKNNESLYLIADTVDVVKNKLIHADESTSEIKTWSVKKQKDNRAYYLRSDSIYSKLRLKNQFFVIKESTPTIDWKFTSETKTILGFTCQAAETTFRGYDFKVFFTRDIPVSSGPWVLNGLPGAILYAENDDKSIIIEAEMINLHSDNTITMEKIKEDFKNHESITRGEYVNQYVTNLQNERKFAQSRGNPDFINALKDKGVNILSVEKSNEKLPPPANIEIRGFVISDEE